MYRALYQQLMNEVVLKTHTSSEESETIDHVSQRGTKICPSNPQSDSHHILGLGPVHSSTIIQSQPKS